MAQTRKSAHTIFHASQRSAQSGGVQSNTLAPDGNSLTATAPGDWVCYRQIDFGTGQHTLFMAYVAATTTGKTIEIRLDAATGDLIGTLPITATGATTIFTEQYTPIAQTQGIHDVYLLFPDGAVGLDWFIFSTNPDDESALQHEARMQWWREARFGTFIHWGPYSVLARGEWVMYFEQWAKDAYEVQAAALLNPTHFDADAWVNLFKQAGSQYMVITAKHHDGFSLYDTQVRNFTAIQPPNASYNIVAFTPYQADPLQALADACKRHGLKFCLYYSILDWHHVSQTAVYDGSGLTSIQPEWKDPYISEMKEQLRELIERYDPAVLWFDGDWGGSDWWWTEADGAALYRYLRVLKPDLIINERVKRDCGLGDFRSPEQYIPATGLPYDWETCMTMNGNWGYHATDNDWKSTETLIQNLVDIVSKGGNFLLNIGPKADGTIPQESSERLNAIAHWMTLYGESIYGTVASPFPQTPTWGRYTQKPGCLYAHVFDWPTNGQLAMPHIENLQRIYLVDAPEISLSYSLADEGIVLYLPTQAPNPYDSVIAFAIPADDFPLTTTTLATTTRNNLMSQSTTSAARSSLYPFQDPDLPIETRIDNLLTLLTPTEKILLLDNSSQTIARLGMQTAGQVEGYHGAAMGGPAEWSQWDGDKSPIPTTQFCQAIGLGETWDPEIVRQAAEAEAIEFRYIYHRFNRGGLVVRAPNADLGRDPRWGRTEECYGEDAYLNGTLTAAFVRGLQGDHPQYLRAAALLKHFLANSNEDTRGHSSSDFDERDFREYYSVPFRMGFASGAACYMTAYNAYNGIPCIIHPVVKEITVKEWGVDGIICTDGGALGLLVSEHHAYPNNKEATAACIKAGITQFLDNLYPSGVTDALADNLLTMADIDQALRGNLRMMIRLGIFDPPENVPYAQVGSEAPWTTEAHRSLARLVTQKSIVLLKNENQQLPLNVNQVKRIAVIGQYADDVLLDWYSGTPPYTVTPLAGIRNKVGDDVVVDYAIDNEGETAVSLARSADVAIVLVGNHPVCGNLGWAVPRYPSEGREGIDRRTITLEPQEESLIQQVYAANPRTIVVLLSSFPYAIQWAQENIPAILHMTHNSQEMGNALADVLFGDYNPAGRLVQTWPQSLDQVPPLMDYNIRNNRTYMYFKDTPLYPFGYGLSYTTFAYANLQTSSEAMTAKDTLTVTVDVKNTGTRAGKKLCSCMFDTWIRLWKDQTKH
ncbi:MAG: alpha-L-fucosidase [Chloroflexota bacterium]